MEVGGKEHLEVPDAGLFPRVLIQPVHLQFCKVARFTHRVHTALDR